MIFAAIRGAEVGLFVMGLFHLFAPKTLLEKISRQKNVKHTVQGWPLRLMGVFCLLPIPLTFLAGFAIGLWAATQGKDVSGFQTSWLPTAIEASMVVFCALAVNVVHRVYGTAVERSRAEDMLA